MSFADFDDVDDVGVDRVKDHAARIPWMANRFMMPVFDELVPYTVANSSPHSHHFVVEPTFDLDAPFVSAEPRRSSRVAQVAQVSPVAQVAPQAVPRKSRKVHEVRDVYEVRADREALLELLKRRLLKSHRSHDEKSVLQLRIRRLARQGE